MMLALMPMPSYGAEALADDLEEETAAESEQQSSITQSLQVGAAATLIIRAWIL